MNKAYYSERTQRYANQWTIQNITEQPTKNDKGRTWLCVYNDLVSTAMHRLGANGLKLWLYLTSIKTEKSNWNLSIEAAMKATGLSRSSVQRGKKELVDNGYLVCCDEEHNLYRFNAMPMHHKAAPEPTMEPTAAPDPTDTRYYLDDDGKWVAFTYADLLDLVDNDEDMAAQIWKDAEKTAKNGSTEPITAHF